MNSKTRYAILLGSLGIFGTSVGLATAQQRDAMDRGKTLFDQRCAPCHGVDGKGDGAAAVYLYPKPRDFTAGQFKVRSTPNGVLPTDQDLFETITRGTPERSMPSFASLSEQDRWQLVNYVKHLTAYVTADGQRVNRFEEALKSGAPPVSIKIGAEIKATAETVAKGKQIYQQMQCAQCHGETGRGDGPSAKTLKDNWGYPVIVRDFTSGAYLGGSTDRDLYLRFTTGMNGTPMPAYAEQLTDEQRWQLVHYVQSLRQKQSTPAQPPADGRIVAKKISGTLSDDPSAPIWNTATAVELPLLNLWQRDNPPTTIRVRALHDGRQLALMLEWSDSAADLLAIRKEDFRDAAAVQFALSKDGRPIEKGAEPFFAMGEKGKPVNIWQWKADWQQDAEGKRADVDTEHPAMHVDYYPEKDALHRPAEKAGNLFATITRTTAAEDLNAEGFGTLKPQPASEQNVSARGVWANGKWRVVFARQLKSKDAGDAQFEAGQQIPVAFAVWDGQFRDRNGQKLVTDWYRLELEK
jgi:mono/diheme cytochrome c family protein